jgi:low affinity Fe/Cu permease
MKSLFSKFARGASLLAGHPATFLCAVLGVAIWAAFGPALGYSENWQLWINTSTTILTFLMVFLLQHTQNQDARAMHVKLDELLRAVEGARNELIDLENLSEEELARYCDEFKELHLKYARVLEKRGKGITVEVKSASVSQPRKPQESQAHGG